MFELGIKSLCKLLPTFLYVLCIDCLKTFISVSLARFDLHKTVFDVSQTSMNCTRSSQCELPLTFWSEDHVVIEVPEHQTNLNTNSTDDKRTSSETDPCGQESLLRGFSSLSHCHQVLLAESVCRPRKPMYLAFLLLAPLMILFCAHIWYVHF